MSEIRSTMKLQVLKNEGVKKKGEGKRSIVILKRLVFVNGKSSGTWHNLPGQLVYLSTEED